MVNLIWKRFQSNFESLFNLLFNVLKEFGWNCFKRKRTVKNYNKNFERRKKCGFMTEFVKYHADFTKEIKILDKISLDNIFYLWYRLIIIKFKLWLW